MWKIVFNCSMQQRTYLRLDEIPECSSNAPDDLPGGLDQTAQILYVQVQFVLWQEFDPASDVDEMIWFSTNLYPNSHFGPIIRASWEQDDVHATYPSISNIFSLF